MTSPDVLPAGRLGGLALEHPLMNAAGTCKTERDVTALARSAVAAVVVGSVTCLARAGNPGEAYASGPGWAVNAFGLPNRGADWYAKHLPTMTNTVHRSGKPLVLSVAGFTPIEYATLTCLGADGGVNAVELNLGCPNTHDESQSRVLAFDPQIVEETVRVACEAAAGRVRVGVKLSPYSDPYLLGEIAAVLGALPVSYIATTNTFPNALALRPDGRPVIGVRYAGLSGPAMKPVGLGQVAQFRDLLPSRIDIVGVGGISTAQDIADYLNAGASAVQAATVYWDAGEDPGAYGRILAGRDRIRQPMFL